MANYFLFDITKSTFKMSNIFFSTNKDLYNLILNKLELLAETEHIEGIPLAPCSQSGGDVAEVGDVSEHVFHLVLVNRKLVVRLRTNVLLS